MDKVVAGTEKGEELLAGAGAAVAVEGQAAKRVFPRLLGRGLDHHLFFGRGGGRVTLVELDDHRHLAELDDVAGSQWPVIGPQAHAINERAVGAFQVTYHPALGTTFELSVFAADGTVIENDFQRPEAAGAQDRIRLPHFSLDIAADAAKANHMLHRAASLVGQMLRVRLCRFKMAQRFYRAHPEREVPFSGFLRTHYPVRGSCKDSSFLRDGKTGLPLFV